MSKNSTAFEKEVGYVTTAKNYLLLLEGLPSAKVNDIIEDEKGNRAIISSLERDHVKALLLTDTLLTAGDRFFLSEKGIELFLGEQLFGRIIDSFGNPIDGKGGLPKPNTKLEFDVVAPGIDKRKEIDTQFLTGVSVIDVLFPLAQGQRQLLFGPISSGKTTFLRDMVVHQAGHDMICIYVGIGKPTAFIRRFASSTFPKGADKYTIIIAALADKSTPAISMAPVLGVAIAEHFSKQGKNVLLIMDDLGSHAKYLREMSLMMKRIPGRQSYPGDIFYQHAHLIERAGSFNDLAGGGNITLLPVIETDIENFTDLIPTNLMATTDGHLFFSAELRAEGYYPSVATDKSVTRVGRQTQSIIQRELSTRVMTLIAEYKHQKEYSRFGTNLSERTKNTLREGELMIELLKQEPFIEIDLGTQIAFLSLLHTSFFDGRELAFLQKHKKNIVTSLHGSPKFERVRKCALNRDITLDVFLDELEKSVPTLKSICRI